MALDEYGRYQLQWMLDHGHGLDELIDELSNIDLDGFKNIREVFDFWEFDVGFGGELWACRQEHADEMKSEE